MSDSAPDDSLSQFAGIVLAAGKAKRMGLPKPALPYGSTTMVGSVVAAGLTAGLMSITVVSGFHSEEVAEAVGDSAVIVHNREPELGNMSSLLVGIDAVGDVDGVVVLLADMPGIQSAVIADLSAEVARLGVRCGWVDYSNGLGHPIALSRSVFDDLRALTGAKPLWPFLSALPRSDVFALRVSSPRPADVNTSEDYAKLMW